MRVQKFGHSCLLVTDGDARVLLDPGSFSRGFESLRGLSAILVTHQHADHLDPDRTEELLRHNLDAEPYADPESARILADRGMDVTPMGPGERFGAGGLPVRTFGGQHSIIHPISRRSPTPRT